MKMKKLFPVLLAVVLCLTALLSGCAKETLAAKAGDREITVQQLQNTYDNSASYASYYGFTLDSVESVEGFQDYLLDSLITGELQAYMARQAGVTLTDEEKAEAQTTADTGYKDTYQQFLTAAEESGSADKEAYANKLFTDALIRNGSTVGKLKKELLQDAEDDVLIEKHKAELLKDKQLSAEELKTRYDEELASQKTMFEADPASYFSYENYSSYGYTCIPLFVPEGLFRVRQILVEDEAVAKDTKARIDAGEDFEALLKELNTDPGMDSNPEGYLVGAGASYVEPFLNAALALAKEGDVSDVVKSDYGYHIIKRLGDEKSRVKPYEEVQETFDGYIQSTIDDQAYNEILTGWLADTSMVTRYEENYRSVGKAALAALTPSPVPETTEAPAEPAVTVEPETTQAPAEPAVSAEPETTEAVG